MGYRYKPARVKVWMVACAVIVALSTALLWQKAKHWREDAHWLRCNRNLKQIGLALWIYQDVYGESPPPFVSDDTGKPLYSWRVLILPFLERGDLYDQIKLDEPWNSSHNRRLAGFMPHVYKCPADNSEEGETSYLAVLGPGTFWSPRKRKLTAAELDMTIVVVESVDSGVSWMEPRDISLETIDRMGGMSSGIPPHLCGGGDEPFHGVFSGYNPRLVGYRIRGANCLFGNGLVRTISENVSAETLRELLTIGPVTATDPAGQVGVTYLSQEQK